MLDPEAITTYTIVTLGVVIAPGPDMAFMLAAGLEGGVSGAVRAALGISTGVAVYVALSALGLGVLVSSAPVAFDAVRVTGALYLVWLARGALASWRHHGRPMSGLQSGGSARGDGAARYFVRGAAVNLANPGILLYFAAVLPQFVAEDDGSTAGQMLVLGLIFLIAGLVVDLVVGVTSGSVRWLQGTGSRGPRIAAACAGLLYLLVAATIVADVVRT